MVVFAKRRHPLPDVSLRKHYAMKSPGIFALPMDPEFVKAHLASVVEPRYRVQGLVGLVNYYARS